MIDTSKLVKLSQVINYESLPEYIRSLLNDGLQIFDGLYINDYKKAGLQGSSEIGHSLEIVTSKQIGFSFFNTNFRLVLNPNSENQSSFFLDLNIDSNNLDIAASIGLDDLTDPSLVLTFLYGTSVKTDFELIKKTLVNLFNADGSAFVTQVNAQLNLSPAISAPQSNSLTEDIYEISNSITGHPNYLGKEEAVFDVVLEGIILPSYDGKTSFEKLNLVFGDLGGQDIVGFIASKLLPDVKASTRLSAALQFPSNILKPVTADGTVISDGSVKVNLLIAESNIGFRSDIGFFFEPNLILSLPPEYPKAEIGNTGIIFGITGGRIDLSENKNIQEANRDGRPESFKGVYFRQASLEIPWIKDTAGENLTIEGRNLLIGNPGGISGQIGLQELSLTGDLPGGLSASISEFYVNFHQNSVIGSGITLKLTIPGIEDGSGQPAEIEIKGAYTDNGFEIAVSEPQGIALKIPGLLDITLYEIGIRKLDNGPVQLYFSADFYFTNKPGFIGDLLPEGIKVNSILFERGSGVKAFTIDLDWEKTEDTRLVYANDILDARIPLNKTILNFITLNGIRAIVENHPNGRDKQFQLLVDAGLKIGPVTGESSNFGIKADLNFRQTKLPEETEVPPLVSNLQFVPPRGIGIGIDAKAVKGGGFLLLDYDNNRYTGALNLAILEKFEVNAFGVLVTQLPSGQQGFSLIALISARFNPAIQLGLGFTLNGLGGLLGLHRRANTELLRSELNSGRVGDLMFPVNPQARFAQIISNLEASFPIEENKFIFGPGAQIGWGTPSLITADIILLLEMPDPIRIIIMGVARSLLPDKNKAILKLQVAFLAVIDFANKSLSVDASIYDSKLLNFRLDGTMALRVLAGDNPYFLITVGGFHPQFRVPGFLNLPAQRRLAISMISGSALSIGAETYYAVSSNSVQFGAALWLKGQIAIIKAEGGFAFDALVMFNPFRFCVAVAAYITIKARLKLKVKIKIKLFKFKVQIKLEDVTLAGVDLRGQLCGPSYWNANATARFSLLGVGKSFDINREWGRKEEVTIPKIDLRALLLEALENDQNWKIEGGTAVDDLVTIRDISDEALILKGNGTLQVEQNTLPLNIEIQKFGNGVPLDDNRFQITRVVFGNQIRSLTASLRDTRDFFAPGEFRNLGDRRLSTRSFEKFPNGVVADPPSAAGALDYGQHKTERTMNFENKVIDAPSPTSNDVRRTTLQNVHLSTAVESAGFTLMAKGNAANRYNRKQKINRFTKTSKRIAVNEERFHIVDCRNLQNHSSLGTSVFSTEIEAKDALKQLTKTNPTLKKEITVVPSFEVAA